MCTALSFLQGSFYFGRNMDLEYSFGEAVVITPREYPLSTKCRGTVRTRYGIIGMAMAAEGFPLYAEAMNEKGLCMAGLNFPGNASYLGAEEATERSVTPYELIPCLLGECENLSQAREWLAHVDLTEIPFRENLPVAPLHWMISDASGSLTVEPSCQGMKIYENPYGVLTNNPPFPFHLENVRQYLHLSPGYPENCFAGQLPLSPFCQGAGALGLPGDFSSASRFVKALFCKMNSLCQEGGALSQLFHILDSVAMVRGTVITPEGKPDMTTYSCCMNATEGIYYYKTYENSQITSVALTEERKNASSLLVFPLRKEQNILWE